jgi:glycosyltransferase involved in cell wall biosynthesis
MKNNICCIFNNGSFYRKSIYQLMDSELGCDFFLGTNLPGNIKEMDYSILKGYKKSLKNLFIFGNYYWQVGSLSIVFKPYKHIIMDGEPYCVSSWFILLFAKLLGKKTYPWSHGWYGRETRPKRIIKKLFFSLAHHVFLYGDYAKELMLKEGFSADKLSCIYNSLDYNNQLAIREKLKPSNIYFDHFKNDFNNLIFVGRLTSTKRLDLLLQAVWKLKCESYNLNLILIGNGEVEAELIELTNKLDLEKNVWFLGSSYDDNELSEYIYNAELCVSPGNVGLTAIHTMVYGTPVITHNNFSFQGPEFEAIEDGVTGTFFEYNNCDSLVQSIKRWFMISPDRSIVREKCYEVVEDRYNPNFQIALLKKVLFQ